LPTPRSQSKCPFLNIADSCSKAAPSSKDNKSGSKVSDVGPDVGQSNIQSPQDSFEKYYSKELDLDEGNHSSFKDEVPIVLHELNDSALNFIQRESYEKALVLL